MANFDKIFKQDCLKYYYDHEGITQAEVAKKFGVKEKTFNKWVKAEREKGPDAFRGSGNYSSEEEKEIARLKRELRDANDAIYILKKAMGILAD